MDSGRRIAAQANTASRRADLGGGLGATGVIGLVVREETRIDERTWPAVIVWGGTAPNSAELGDGARYTP